jgi:hypothetical protein
VFYLKNIEDQETLVLGLYNILSNHKLQLSIRVYSQINKNLNHWVMYLYFYCKYSHRFVYNWFCIFLFIITLFVRLCERVGILLTCGKQHLSLKLKVWTHKTSLYCPRFIEVPMPSYAVMYMCIRSIDFTILVLFRLCSVFCFVVLKQLYVYLCHHVN